MDACEKWPTFCLSLDMQHDLFLKYFIDQNSQYDCTACKAYLSALQKKMHIS